MSFFLKKKFAYFTAKTTDHKASLYLKKKHMQIFVIISFYSGQLKMLKDVIQNPNVSLNQGQCCRRI